MKINLKKILVSLLMIAGFVSYAGYQRYFVGQQATVTNPPLDIAATDTTSGMVSSTTASQAETTLPPAETTLPQPSSTQTSLNIFRGDDGENDDEDGGNFTAQQTAPASPAPSNNNISAATSTTSGSSSASTTTTAPGNTVTAANSLYKDGQYDGNTADAYYGFVQVRAIIQGGQLTDVQFLRYPSDRRNSIEINNYALPILKSEAIQAQNTNVNIVSGATYSSFAFVDSLSNALNQAQV